MSKRIFPSLSLSLDEDDAVPHWKQPNTTVRLPPSIEQLVVEMQRESESSEHASWLSSYFREEKCKVLVRHKNRMFDVPHSHANKKYSTIVTSCKSNREILKLINCADHPDVDRVILTELAFQREAQRLSLQSPTPFVVPAIGRFGKVHADDLSSLPLEFPMPVVWFFTMESLPMISLKEYILQNQENLPQVCNALSEKLNRIRSFLEDHDIYHNDFHEENILVHEDNPNKIGILDFGNARSHDTNVFDDRKWVYDCARMHRIGQSRKGGKQRVRRTRKQRRRRHRRRMTTRSRSKCGTNQSSFVS